MFPVWIQITGVSLRPAFDRTKESTFTFQPITNNPYFLSARGTFSKISRCISTTTATISLYLGGCEKYFRTIGAKSSVEYARRISRYLLEKMFERHVNSIPSNMVKINIVSEQ